MVEGEEALGPGDASTTGMVVPESEATARAIGALEVNPPEVPKKWILKGKAPSHEAVWVPVASGILDLWFQRKELLPAPI
nr:hypothetical protein CFP56_06679 [Quercus suber]